MELREYQNRALKTAVYPYAGTRSAGALAYLGLGLGEAGEIQNKIKKVLRDADGEISEEARAAIAGELGDLLWYVAQICSELGVPLDAVAEGNLAKLASRAERGVLGGSGDDR